MEVIKGGDKEGLKSSHNLRGLASVVLLAASTYIGGNILGLEGSGDNTAMPPAVTSQPFTPEAEQFFESKDPNIRVLWASEGAFYTGGVYGAKGGKIVFEIISNRDISNDGKWSPAIQFEGSGDVTIHGRNGYVFHVSIRDGIVTGTSQRGSEIVILEEGAIRFFFATPNGSVHQVIIEGNIVAFPQTGWERRNLEPTDYTASQTSSYWQQIESIPSR